LYQFEWGEVVNKWSDSHVIGLVELRNTIAKTPYKRLARFEATRIGKRKTIDLAIEIHEKHFAIGDVEIRYCFKPNPIYVEKLRIDINDKKSIEAVVIKELDRIYAALREASLILIKDVDQEK